MKESLWHKNGKLHVVRVAQSLGWDAGPEERRGLRRTDCWARRGTRSVAFELQNERLARSTLRERTEDLLDTFGEVVWIFSHPKGDAREARPRTADARRYGLPVAMPRQKCKPYRRFGFVGPALFFYESLDGDFYSDVRRDGITEEGTRKHPDLTGVVEFSLETAQKREENTCARCRLPMPLTRPEHVCVSCATAGRSCQP